MARTGCWSHTQRVLLTYERVCAYELPAIEDKYGDPRRPTFARRYGFDPRRPVQWEAEALEPAELQRLVLAAVAPHVDRDALARQIAREEQQRRCPVARRSPLLRCFSSPFAVAGENVRDGWGGGSVRRGRACVDR
ncbi:hypothetical protein ACIG3E_23520 [Streptomyces sp. NPDC053474]|uniref:hypothetical protein n=1 Tax=Streptomyces sp. NPDC053474 TaxID=3365704 RepID=UPI0037D135BB